MKYFFVFYQAAKAPLDFFMGARYNETVLWKDV